MTLFLISAYIAIKARSDSLVRIENEEVDALLQGIKRLIVYTCMWRLIIKLRLCRQIRKVTIEASLNRSKVRLGFWIEVKTLVDSQIQFEQILNLVSLSPKEMMIFHFSYSELHSLFSANGSLAGVYNP